MYSRFLSSLFNLNYAAFTLFLFYPFLYRYYAINYIIYILYCLYYLYYFLKKEYLSIRIYIILGKFFYAFVTLSKCQCKSIVRGWLFPAYFLYIFISECWSYIMHVLACFFAAHKFSLTISKAGRWTNYRKRTKKKKKRKKATDERCSLTVFYFLIFQPACEWQYFDGYSDDENVGQFIFLRS